METADEKTKTGKPIVYGIIVPTNAETPELGLEFVKFVIGDAWQKIFSDMGQPPIVPPLGSGNVPEALESLVELEDGEATPTPSPTSTPTPTLTSTATPATTITPTPEEPGFGAIYAITGLSVIAYLALRRRKE